MYYVKYVKYVYVLICILIFYTALGIWGTKKMIL